MHVVSASEPGEWLVGLPPIDFAGATEVEFLGQSLVPGLATKIFKRGRDALRRPARAIADRVLLKSSDRF